MTTPFRPLIRTQIDLERTWKRLMSPLGFSEASIWMMLIDSDDRPIPQITEIPDAGTPTAEDFEGLAAFLSHLRDELEVPRVAFLRSRPGRSGTDADDRTWAAGLYDAARRAGLTPEVVHLANDVSIVPIPYDDLPAAG